MKLNFKLTALLHIQNLAGRAEDGAFLLYGRQIDDEYQIFSLAPIELQNEKAALKADDLQRLQEFQIAQDGELTRIGVLFINKNETVPADTTQARQLQMQHHEWVPIPIEVAASPRSLQELTFHVVRRGEESTVKAGVAAWAFERVVLAGLAATIE